MKDTTTDQLLVCNIEWERTFLTIEIQSLLKENLSFSLRNFKRWAYQPEGAKQGEERLDIEPLQVIPVEARLVADGLYRINLNITCIDGRTFLQNGTWQIQACPQSGPFSQNGYSCSVSFDLAHRFDDVSRIFRYGRGKYAYNMSFSTYLSEDQTLSFVLNSRFMIENDTWNRRRYVQEARTFQGKMIRIRKTAVTTLMRAYHWVAYHLTGKKGNRVLFLSETKDYIDGNLEYLHNRMLERCLEQQFEISHWFHKSAGQHMSIPDWVRFITLLAKQDFIFVDNYVPTFNFIDPGDKTLLVQLWHAGEGFKAVGYCRFGGQGTPFPVGICHKKYDYIVTESERLISVFGEVFGLPRSAFLPYGMPRLDGFLNQEKIQSFKEKFYTEHPECIGKKIILFAPTYRGVGQNTANYDYSQLDLTRIYDMCGEDYLWAFKMHPFIQDFPEIPENYRSRIIDLSNGNNINDLFYISDYLVTDYSSNFFEYALLKRPIVFFTYDREEYELARGVHRPVKETAPGRVCDTFDELIDAFEHNDFEYDKTLAFSEETFKNYDGHACDRIIDNIILKRLTDGASDEHE